MGVKESQALQHAQSSDYCFSHVFWTLDYASVMYIIFGLLEPLDFDHIFSVRFGNTPARWQWLDTRQ